MVKRGRADPRDARRARAAESERRARMFVHAHLAWLEGFPELTPAGLRWWRLDGPAPFTVDGARLARARRARRTLVADHADALAAVVGDVVHWASAVDAVLVAVGTALHHGGLPVHPVDVLAAPVRRRLRALVASYPTLEPVIDAAGIAMLAHPDQLAAALRWIDARGAELMRLVAAEPGPRGVLAVLRLAGFAAEVGGPASDALVALVCVDAPLPGPAIAMGRMIAAALRSGGVGRPVAPKTSTSIVIDWMARLAAADADARKRALALLALLDLATPLLAARRWWLRVAPGFERARALLDLATGPGPDIGYVRANLESVEAAVKAAPIALDLIAALASVELAAWSGAAARFAPLVRLLAAVPVRMGALARLRLLDELHDDAEVHGEAPQAWLWDALADELAAGATPERLLAPWRAAIDGTGTCFAQPIRGVIKSRAGARRVAALLAACARKGDLTYVVVDRAMAFASVAIAPAVVADTLEAAARLRGYFDTAQVRAAVALGGDAVKELVASLETISALCDELPSRAAGEVAALVEHARTGGGAWVLRRLLDDQRGRTIADAAAVAAVVPRGRWPALTGDTRGVRWMGDYPVALRGALVGLASADPDAVATARRILRRDLPHPDDAAGELVALRSGRKTGVSAAGRLRRLEAGSRAPGPARLARLAAKLERVAAQIAMDRFGAAVTAAATASITESCGLPAWPGWPLDRQLVAVLAALVKLPARPRELAVKLLRRRAGPRPWDLRDEARNLAFVAGLRQRGIDPAPWLDDVARPVTAADGTSLSVGFASDPLDIFVMGEHFNTCLGSDGINFFSVVTNAADVNKRVLYAHRADGKVAGRCLFALTDGGRILTFEPYAHDGKLDFERIVRDRALELAARMGTEVVGNGTVSTLLADDWYDDGARDLVERFATLATDSPFRIAMPTIPVGELPARLAVALGHALDDVTLPLVVALPEMKRHPMMLVALGPALLAATAIPAATMIQAARIALAAGDLALADRLVAGHARPSLMIDSPRWLGDVLARVRPSLALALLRATRERGVRGWRDESVERIAVAALAMETLRRPRQAAALYRFAIGRGWKALADELRPRLAAIEQRSA